MELRHVRYFVAAVEEGSIQAAANRLNVAQPALSRQIRDLEHELGSMLLERHARGVRLTAAGMEFHKDALAILQAVQDAVFRARQLRMQKDRRVTFGIVRTASKYRFPHDATESFVREHPEIDLETTSAASPELVDALRDGRLDLGLIYGRQLDPQTFDHRLVHAERYVLAIHPQHKFAARETIHLADLKGEPLIWLSRRNNADNHDALLQRCRASDLEPLVGHEAMSHEEQIETVLVKRGICLTVASTQLMMGTERLLYQAIADLDLEIVLRLVWRRDAVAGFARELRRYFDASIDAHQAAIGSGAASWMRDRAGEVIVRCPQPA